MTVFSMITHWSYEQSIPYDGTVYFLFHYTAGALPSAVAATVAVVTDDAETAQVMTADPPPVDPELPAAAPEVIAPDEDDMEPLIRLTPEFNGTNFFFLRISSDFYVGADVSDQLPPHCPVLHLLTRQSILPQVHIYTVVHPETILVENRSYISINLFF